MVRIALLVAVGAGLLAAGGCHTVVNGTTQPIVINSDPPGALVQVEGLPMQTTPAVVRLPRGFDSYVTITKAGYEPSKVFVTSTLANGSIGQTLASGAIVGAAIDIASGAAYKLSPEKIDVVLKPVVNPAASVEIPARPTGTAPGLPGTPRSAGLASAAPTAERTPDTASDRALQRMARIRAMLDEGIISEDDYQLLRAQVMREMAQAGVEEK